MGLFNYGLQAHSSAAGFLPSMFSTRPAVACLSSSPTSSTSQISNLARLSLTIKELDISATCTAGRGEEGCRDQNFGLLFGDFAPRSLPPKLIFQIVDG